MKKILISYILLFVCLLTTTTVVAQVPKHTADAHFERAQVAYQETRYDAAMLELEQAWRKEERPVFLYWRVLTLQAMGEHALALNLIDENRSLLLGASEVQDLHLVEERSRSALSVATPVPNPPVAQRSTLDTVGPIVLGILGVGLVAGSIPFWQEECEIPRGDRCLATSEPEYLIAGLLAGAGATAMGGAVVWWVLGSPESPESQVTLILAPGAIVGRF